MITEPTKYFFSRLIEDTLGYFSVYDFLKLKVKKIAEKPLVYKTAKDFWVDVIAGKKVSNGHVIKLKGFYLSEYVPKLPGKLWTKESKDELISGHKEVIATTSDGKVNILSLEGKRKIINAGYGSVRLKPNTSGIYCSLLSGVSEDCWFADSGIPIVVSKSVYDRFLTISKTGAPWIEELEGILYLDQDIPLLDKIPRAIGSSLSEELIDCLISSINLPKCFVYVPSPLNIKFRTNDTHPDVVAWTTFKTRNENELFHYTYSTFNPNKEGSLEYSINFIENYVTNFSGVKILTDFDGKIRRFNSSVDLTMGIKIKDSPVLCDMIKTIDRVIDI